MKNLAYLIITLLNSSKRLIVLNVDKINKKAIVELNINKLESATIPSK